MTTQATTPIDLTGAPTLLARVGHALQIRLPADRLERLAELVERIPPESTKPVGCADEAYRWFIANHVERWLAAVDLTFSGKFEAARTEAGELWDTTRRDLGARWLAAFDTGADAIHRSCAGAIWPEMRPYFSEAAPGWDAAACASRIVAAGRGRQTLEDVVGPEQDAALDLFEQLVWSAS